MLKLINNKPGIPKVYVQYPGKDTPANIYGGTWRSIFDTEGVFFRTPGGNALAFNAGIQTDVVRNATGTMNYAQSRSFASSGVFTHTTVNAPDWSTGNTHAYGRSITFDLSRSVPTGPENRPNNRTIRLWEFVEG